MSAFDTLDLKTEINTILNKSGELMEVHNTSMEQKLRKSILKIPNNFKDEETRRSIHEELINQSIYSDIIPRPKTLDEFAEKEKLETSTNLKSTLKIDDLDDDDEVWVMEIPRTIDPELLNGQVLQFGDKSKFKIGEDRYYAINRNSKSSLTCVFSTDNELNKYKAVNVKPAGLISIRRKLPGSSKIKLDLEKSEIVPYPKNIKQRHPFFGVHVNTSSVKNEKRQ